MRLWQLTLLIGVAVVALFVGSAFLAGKAKPVPKNMAAECGSDKVSRAICAEFR